MLANADDSSWAFCSKRTEDEMSRCVCLVVNLPIPSYKDIPAKTVIDWPTESKMPIHSLSTNCYHILVTNYCHNNSTYTPACNYLSPKWLRTDLRALTASGLQNILRLNTRIHNCTPHKTHIRRKHWPLSRIYRFGGQRQQNVLKQLLECIESSAFID